MSIRSTAGFGSSEAFSRAFKNVFGSSPMDYRKAGVNLVTNAKRKLQPEDVFHIANNITHYPKILMMEEVKVVGIRGNTSLSDNRIPELWEQFLRIYKELLATSGIGYGICETQKTVYTQNGDVMFSTVVGSPVEDFELYERKVVSFDDPDNVVKIFIPLK